MISLFLLKLTMAFVAVLLFFCSQFLILRLFDCILGIDFKAKCREASPESVVSYYSMRYLGTCIAMGLIICLAFIM